jgi:hypothetical protein
LAAKNIVIALIFTNLIAFAAISFRPGNVTTMGQGGGYFLSGGGEGSNENSWRGGNDDHDDDHGDHDDHDDD